MLLFYTYLQAAAEAEVPVAMRENTSKEPPIVVITNDKNENVFEIPTSFVENISPYFFKMIKGGWQESQPSEDGSKKYSVSLPEFAPILEGYKEPLLFLFEHLSRAQNKNDFFKVLDQFIVKNPLTQEPWFRVELIELYKFFDYIGLQFDVQSSQKNHENYFETQERFIFPVTKNSLELFNKEQMLVGFEHYMPPVKLVFDTVETFQRWSGKNTQITIAKPMVIKIEEALNDEKLIALNKFLDQFTGEVNPEMADGIPKVTVEIKGRFDTEGLTLINKMIMGQKIVSLDFLRSKDRFGDEKEIKIESAKELLNELKKEANKGHQILKHLTLTVDDLNDERLIELNNLLEEFTPGTILLGINGRFKAEGLGLINDMLQSQKINSLDLSGNKIGAAGVKDLAEALKNNTTLTSLDLYGNQIGDAGAQALTEAFKDNTTLTSLYLGYNQIGDEGVKDLAETLKGNTTLTSLDLSWNNVKAEGAKDLADALKGNKTLTSFDLSSNQIGDAGASALVEALTVNTSLTSLNLLGNQIGAVGRAALRAAQEEARRAGRVITIKGID